MKLSIKAGSTSQSVNVFIQDSTSTTGAGLIGLVFNTSGLTAYYSFSGAAATSTAITLATLATVTTAWSSGGFIQIDSTHMPGWYRLDLPNAAIASGSGRSVSLHLQGATNMAPTPVEIELTGWDNQDGVHGGMSALPNTACTTNASLITSGAGTDQLTVSGGIASSDAKKINAVSTSSVTTINANIGEVHAWVYDSNNYPGVNVVDVGGQAATVAGTVNANVTNWNTTAVAGSIPPDVVFIHSGTAQAGGASTITLDAGASATNNFYQNQVVLIRSGTGAGQSATIASYVGSTKVATIAGTWATNPDNTSVFSLLPDGAVAAVTGGVNVTAINSVSTSSVTAVNASIGTTQPINFTGTSSSALVKSDMQDIAGGAVNTSSAQIGVNLVNIMGSAASASSAQLGVNVVNWGGTATSGAIPPDVVFLHSGTAQGGASGSITLDAGASVVNNFYNNQIIFIRSGTGTGQSAIVSAYNGTTKVATIVGSWATNPDNTSVFTLLPMGSITTTVSGGVNVTQWGGTNVVPSTVAGVPIVDVGYTKGTISTGAAGSVGVDWAHIANPTTTVNLSGTTISAAQAVANVSGAVGSVTGNVGGSVGSISGVTFPTGFSTLTTSAISAAILAQTLNSPRALDSIADDSITANDGFWCAVAAAAGRESITGTAYAVKTPSTGTVLRTFTLDSSSQPTSRS